MPLKPVESGERTHVDLRAGGIGIDKWRGVVREGDAASIGDSNLFYAENVRLSGGKILSRGGQSAVNGTAAAGGCIDGFFDAGDMGAQSPGNYVATTLYFGGGVDGYLQKILADNTRSTVVSELVPKIALYDDYLYWEGTLGGGVTQYRRVAVGDTSAADTFTVTVIHASDIGPQVGGEADGRLWVIYAYDEIATPNNGRIYSWDGASLVSEHSFTYSGASSEVIFGSEIVFEPFLGGFVAFPRGTEMGRRFIYRASDGTLSFPRFSGTFAAPDSTGCPGRASVYGSKVYFPFMFSDGTPVARIQSFDGATVAVEHTLPASAAVFATALLGGYLYYVWATTGGASPDIKLGRYDGATWTNSYATIDTTVDWTVEDLVAHNNSLYLLTKSGTSGIWKSDGADTTSWTELDTTATSAIGVSILA